MKIFLKIFVLFLFVSTLSYSQDEKLTQEQKQYLDRFGNPTQAENIPVNLNGVIKWSEGFEDVTFPPTGWQVFNIDNGANQWIRYTITPIFGTASAVVEWESSALTNDDWLVTPQFLVEPGDTLKFWAKRESSTYTDSCQIWYSTVGGTPPTDYTYITTVIPTTSPALYEVDLSAIAGQNVYIAFRYNALNQYRLYLDSVYVENTFPPLEVEVSGPKEFSLAQNYPNPFNPTTTIDFNLAVDSKVTLKVFDILGQEVITLVNGNLSAGSHKVNFDASNLNSGVYLYRIDAIGVDGKTFSSVKKMILSK